MKQRVAIIGAGVSGLVLANRLGSTALVTVFEKSNGVSGRLSTRSADNYQFDHGAKAFVADDASFATFLQPYLNKTVFQWTPKISVLGGEKVVPWENEQRYVCVPKMTSLCKELCKNVDIRLNTEICELQSVADKKWVLKCKQGTVVEEFDWIISTAPQPQTCRLFANLINSVLMEGCFALMLGFPDASALKLINFDVANVCESFIEWIVVDSKKPGRNPKYPCLVIHSSSQPDTEEKPHIISKQMQMQCEVNRLTGIDCSRAEYATCHRWRYSGTKVGAGRPYLIDVDNRLGVCADWCSGGDVQSAYLSANGLSERLKPILQMIS